MLRGHRRPPPVNRSSQLLAVLLCFAAALGAGVWGAHWRSRAQALQRADPTEAELARLAMRVEELSGQLTSLRRQLEELPSGPVVQFRQPPPDLVERVAAQRELGWKEAPEWEVVDRAGLTSAVHAELRRQRRAQDWEQVGRAWFALGVLEEQYDLFSQEATLLTIGNRAFYQPQDQHIVVLDDMDPEAAASRRPLANALAAALVDQHLRSQNLPLYQENNDDAVLAARALAEGDPALLTDRVADPAADLLGGAPPLAGEDSQALELVSPLLRARRQFPSVFGRQFCEFLQTDGDSGWAGVDAAYARPPQSTAEILHPELYLRGWQPSRPDWNVPLWRGGELVADNVIGEFVLGEFLAGVIDQAQALQSAQGWRGDRFQVFAVDGSADALVWQLDWLDEAEATEAQDAFAARYEAWWGGEGEPVDHAGADALRWGDDTRQVEIIRTAPATLLLVEARPQDFEALRASVPAPAPLLQTPAAGPPAAEAPSASPSLPPAGPSDSGPARPDLPPPETRWPTADPRRAAEGNPET